MKKKILLVVSIMIACVGLTACGADDSGAKSENQVEKTEEKENNISQKMYEDKYVILKLDSVKSDSIHVSVKNKTDKEISISDEWTKLEAKGYPASGSIMELPPETTMDYEYFLEIKSTNPKTYQAKFELWNSDNEEIKKITTKKIKIK